MNYLIVEIDGCYNMIKEDLVRSINYTDRILLTDNGAIEYGSIMMRTYNFNEGMPEIHDLNANHEALR